MEDAIFTGERARKTWNAIFIMLAVLSVVMVLLCPMRGLESGDEGVISLGGWRVLSHQVPGKDFFSIIPPFSYLVTAGAYRLGGITLEANRGLAVAYAFLLALAMLLLSKKLISSPLLRSAAIAPLLSCGVASWLLPSHHWLADILALFAVYLLWQVSEAPLPSWKLFAGGIAAALCVMTMQDQGGILFLGLAAWLLFSAGPGKRIKRFAIFISGAVVIFGAFAIWLLPSTGINVLIHDWIFFPLTNYHKVPGNSVAPLMVLQMIGDLFRGGIFASHPVISLFWLLKTVALCAIFPATVLALWKARSEISRKTMWLIIIGLSAFLLPAIRRPGLTNLEWALPVWSVFGAFCLDKLSQRGSSARRTASITALIFIIAFSSAAFIRIPSLIGCDGAELQTERGTLVDLSPAIADQYRGILSKIEFELDEDDNLFTTGFDSMINFMSGYANPTSFDVFVPGSYTPADQVDKAICELEKYDCRWIVRSRYLPTFAPWNSYVNKNFQRIYSNRRFELWERKNTGQK